MTRTNRRLKIKWWYAIQITLSNENVHWKEKITGKDNPLSSTAKCNLYLIVQQIYLFSGGMSGRPKILLNAFTYHTITHSQTPHQCSPSSFSLFQMPDDSITLKAYLYIPLVTHTAFFWSSYTPISSLISLFLFRCWELQPEPMSVPPISTLNLLLNPEDRGSILIQKLSVCLQEYLTSHTR